MLSLSQILGDVSGAHRQSPEDWARSLTRAVRDAALHHHARNGYYRAQCEVAGVDPAMVHGLDDLRHLPLLPVGLLRRPEAHLLLTCSLAEVETETRVPGPGGASPVVRRNAETETRTLIGLTGTYREFLGLSGGAGLFLGPPARVLTVLHGVLDHHVDLDDDAGDPEPAADQLRRWQGGPVRHVLGPGPLVRRLVRSLADTATTVRLDPYSMVITLGGRTRSPEAAGEAEAFRDRCHDRLGVRRENVREVYAMAESSLLAVECQVHRKHVPPWCHVSARDPDDVRTEVAPGASGVIAVLDALNTSYPGFLLSEDVGAVETGTCPCGRTGQVLVVHGRRQGPEQARGTRSLEEYLAAG
ncbi:MAG TPA: acyl-protein synthetase, partial [Citricoccus sp.]